MNRALKFASRNLCTHKRSNVIPRRFFTDDNDTSQYPTRLRVFTSVTHDPFLNLACEEALFRQHIEDRHDPLMQQTRTLYLWCNDPSIVIGRHQSAHRECKLNEMTKRGVHLIRRRSGGGAVYQDRGNAIFSFIGSAQAESKLINNQILTAALRELGVQAFASGRNDIEVFHNASQAAGADAAEGKRKISGAAFRLESGVLLHHGTMLLNVDMNALSLLLNPNRLKLESKAIKSVTARVINLATLVPGLNRRLWDSVLTTAFVNHYESAHKTARLTGKAETVPSIVFESHLVDHEHVLATNDTVKARYLESKSDEWRLGNEPDFTQQLETRFSWGTVHLGLQVEHNVIVSCRVFTDSLVPSLAPGIESALNQCTHTPNQIAARLQTAMDSLDVNNGNDNTDLKQQLQDVRLWLLDV